MSMWKDDARRFGWISILLHWLVAAMVVGLFALGLWMTGLSYYDPWYRQAPDLHKGIGVLLFLLLAFRLVWRSINGRPGPVAGSGRLEHRLAVVAHGALYALMILVMISGYLISTADGRGIDVFGLFSVPATIQGVEGQEDMAGTVHLALAIGLVGLAGLHALAALKHHFLDRDETLKRMLRP